MSTPEKALALVIRLVDFSETSVILTLFSREFGKIQGLAKGGRRPKGPFEAALDLLGIVRVVFLRKSSLSLDLVTEAKLERRFRPRGRDLSSLYAGYYVAELLNQLTDDDDPHPELFDQAAETLRQLSQTAGLPVEALVLRFEMMALRLLGHLPSLEECVECGNPVEISGRVAFGQLSGGVLCKNCRIGKQQVVSVSAAVMHTLAAFADTEQDNWQQLAQNQRIPGELRAVLNRYLANLLGHKPKMWQYLAKIGS